MRMRVGYIVTRAVEDGGGVCGHHHRTRETAEQCAQRHGPDAVIEWEHLLSTRDQARVLGIRRPRCCSVTYTVAEVAQALGISPREVRHLCQRRGLGRRV